MPKNLTHHPLIKIEWLVTGPFQSCATNLGTLKVFLQKDLKNTKSDSVDTETQINNHMTDSQSAERESRLLPSNVLSVDYTATPLDFYLHDQLMVFSDSLFEKTHAKRQY